MQMKKNLAAVLTLSLIVGVVAMVGIGGAVAGDAGVEQTTIAIDGMTCGGCVGAVKIQLKRTEGVTDYEVSLDDGVAVVTFDPTVTSPEAIAESISKSGFDAKVKSA